MSSKITYNGKYAGKYVRDVPMEIVNHLMRQDKVYGFIEQGEPFTADYDGIPVHFEFNKNQIVVTFFYNGKVCTAKVDRKRFLEADRDRFSANLSLQEQEAQQLAQQ